MAEKAAKENAKPIATKTAPAMPSGCDALLSNAQAALALSISIRKLQEMISTGEFPHCDFRIGDSPRWRVSTLNGWIEAQAQANGPKPKGI